MSLYYLFNTTNRNGNNNNSMGVKRVIYIIAIGTTILITFILKHYIDVHHNNDNGISIQSSFRPLNNHFFKKDDSSSISNNQRHRGLFFLRVAEYCRPISGAPGESYQTATVLPIIYFFTQIFYPNDIPGACGEVCTDICDHKPCYSDYVSPDFSLCECFTDGIFLCKTNSVCDTANDFCKCNAGYEGDALAGCVDYDECRDNVCQPGFICVNTPGSYNCQ